MATPKSRIETEGDTEPDRPTSYDVAQLAGVSQSAVSRCFRVGGSIAPQTRRRVEAAAKKLGYQPNAFASGLITKRTNLVAVIITNLTNLYYPEVLAALSHRLDQRGMRVLLFALQHESDIDAALDQVWRYRVDGAICAVRLSASQLRKFERHKVPVVLYNRTGEGTPAASVCCDPVHGENLLVDRLLGAGHRRFGIIGGPIDSFVGRQRIEAATARLRLNGVEPVIVGGQFNHESGAAGLRALLSGDTRPDAVICVNDLMAIGAIDAARHEFGLKLPNDLSIVGFDGVGPARWPSYMLTTMRQPVNRMTEAAVTMIVERIETRGLPSETRSFCGELLEGTSARLGDVHDAT